MRCNIDGFRRQKMWQHAPSPITSLSYVQQLCLLLNSFPFLNICTNVTRLTGPHATFQSQPQLVFHNRGHLRASSHESGRKSMSRVFYLCLLPKGPLQGKEFEEIGCSRDARGSCTPVPEARKQPHLCLHTAQGPHACWVGWWQLTLGGARCAAHPPGPLLEGPAQPPGGPAACLCSPCSLRGASSALHPLRPSQKTRHH